MRSTGELESHWRRYAFKDSLKYGPTGLPTRTILKDRDAKPLVESLKQIGGPEGLSHKSRVELEKIRDTEVIFVDGLPVAFRRKETIAPVLVNEPAIARLPGVVVDMGAVPHVVSGADIMAPGVRAVRGQFSSGQLVVVVDEKHGKHLAVGRCLLDSVALAQSKKGKVVQNLHYVGDPIWEVTKGTVRGVAEQS